MIRALNSNNPCKTCKKNYLSPDICKETEYDYICDGCTRYYCCQNVPEDEEVCPYYEENNL